MNQYKCDKCGKMFDLKPKTEKLQNEIQKTYIKCSYCKEKFTAYYTDKEIRKLQTRQRVLQNNKTLEITTEEKQTEFDGNKKKIKALMDDLRGRMEATT